MAEPGDRMQIGSRLDGDPMGVEKQLRGMEGPFGDVMHTAQQLDSNCTATAQNFGLS